ncbi:MAG: cell division protein ZapA [Burkholderiaceae bacterium]
MKQLEVQIMGQSYLLGCPEGGEQRLLEAVEKVDSAMCRIRDAGKIKARDRIAVLAALNLAFDLGESASLPADASAALPLAPPAPLNGNGSAAHARTGANESAHGGADHAADHAADARLAQVLQRLEQALGNDGRLI